MKQTNWRVPIAFLLAPVVPCALTAGTLAALSGNWSGAVFAMVMMTLVSLVVSLALCVPAYVMLKRRGPIRLAHCLVAGACAALVFDLATHATTAYLLRDVGYSAGDSGGATFVDGSMTPHGVAVAARGLVADMIHGVAIAACFWGIAFWRREQGVNAEP